MGAPNILIALALISTSSFVATKPLPTNWDGLVQVKSKRMEWVYLLPNADFRPYSNIQYDPVEIATRKDWLRDYNSSSRGFSNRITDREVRAAITEASGKFDRYFATEFTKAGYTVVNAPGPDVLRVSVAVMNLQVSAPDRSASMTRTYTRDAGQAALVLEARDSLTNQLLGRVVDRKLAGDTGPMLRTRASNWGDFEGMFKNWAKVSVQGLTELKSRSPIDTSGIQRK